MKYLRKNLRTLLTAAFLIIAYHAYFLFLLPDRDYGALWYLDFLLLVCLGLWGIFDILRFHKQEREKEELLNRDSLVWQEYPEKESRRLAEHEQRILSKLLTEQYTQKCDLQDYISKWCHEVKLPLAAGLLMTEKITDVKLRQELKEQLERISQQLNGALLGCKVQSSLFDLQVRFVSLKECVKESVRNNRFFLIRGQFQIELHVGEEKVYTDPEWLIYILDQLISNAVKYAGKEPVLKLFCRQEGDRTWLYVEDNGEGIRQEDIPRIFEKGYTGTNRHNGRYKSTGMGLYMAAQIAGRLDIKIKAESSPGEYTRFILEFRDTGEYLQLKPESL